MVDAVFLPMRVVAGRGTGPLPETGQLLGLEGSVVVASLRCRQGRLEVRVFNPSDEDATVALPGRTGWIVDLRGRQLGAFTATAMLDPHSIMTISLDP
jgi:hypothetical protein